MNPIPSNRHESFPLLSIRHPGSRFARNLENMADLGFEGGLKMLLIRVDSIEWTRIVSPAVDSTCRKSICARLAAVPMLSNPLSASDESTQFGCIANEGRISKASQAFALLRGTWRSKNISQMEETKI